MMEKALIAQAAPNGFLYEALGLSKEEKDMVTSYTQKIVKRGIEDKVGHAAIICNVWNKFTEPKEAAYALYILQHSEAEVSIQELFKLPTVTEAVESV